MRHKRLECKTSNTNATRVLQERRKCYTNDRSASRVKNLHFDDNASENIFSHPYIYYIASERLQRLQEQFHSKNYLVEMLLSHAKIRFKNAPRKLNFLMVKAISKSYTVDCCCKCPRTFPHSYEGSFLITILCSTTDILFSKNY